MWGKMSCSRINSKQEGGTEDILFCPLPSTLRTSPLEVLQNCVALFGNSNIKNQDPWKFHMISFWTPLEISLLFWLTPGTSTVFFNTPENSTSSTPPTCLDFFWNSPMSMDVTPKNSYGAMIDLTKHNLLVINWGWGWTVKYWKSIN